MSKYKEIFIEKFLNSREWKLERQGKLFKYYLPPSDLTFPEGYRLEIPIFNKDITGYDNYIDRLIKEFTDFFPTENNFEDLQILFSKDDSILKYRIFDAENIDGSISFLKNLETLDGFKKVLSQAVTFTITEKPIFGNAKFEVESYLNRCKSLQTEKGSYVTKLEIPNDTIYSTISKLETSTVNNKLFDVIEYIESEIFNAKSKIEINENYLIDQKHLLNFELFNAIKDIYSKSKINNIEYQLSSNIAIRKIVTKKVQSRINIFNNYLKELKNILLKVEPLEIIGQIKRLTSNAPQHSKTNEILIDAEIANNKETIKIILDSEKYLEAIEAHKNELKIKIKGMAKQGKNMLTITEVEKFEILKK